MLNTRMKYIKKKLTSKTKSSTDISNTVIDITIRL